MPQHPLSPELVLVDPDLAARARAALPDPPLPLSGLRPAPRPLPRVPSGGGGARRRPAYPLWARATAALWLLVIGILIGGAAIPHAQDRPRLVDPTEEAAMCALPPASPAAPPALPAGPRAPRGDP
ncbi:MAG: hypothetical protein RMM28_08115 [Thermoleophilia bacterium]|nr:hypothetical protein [Gaiellaceae bacterium]MDW8339086.1 hypothetical protein [Thermoleophilia bacterium]